VRATLKKDGLVEVLNGKYLYPKDHIHDWTAPGSGAGVVLKGATGAAYLLAVATGEKQSRVSIEPVLSAIRPDSTIGVVAFVSNEKPVGVFRRRHAAQGWDEISDIEYFFKPRKGSDVSPSRVLLPISKDLESLFFEIHSAMRDVDGLHADEALQELCKIIYTRSYEEEVAAEKGKYLLNSERFGTTEEYAAAIRSFYKDAADYDLRVFRLKIPQYERSRGVFNEPLRLSSPALAKIYKLIEPFDLSTSHTDIKGRAFQKVLGRAVRSGMGQYFTPNPICELMSALVEPKVSDLIVDPFCGSGHFLTECLKRVASIEGKTTKAFHEFAFGKLHGIEKSERMVRIAMTDMRLNGDGHSNIRCTDALLEFGNYPDIAPDSFDVVITNPPFGSLLGQDALASLGEFELAKAKKNLPLEIVGLERSIQFLRPGGRLAILLPDNVFSADSARFVRGWLLDKIIPRIIISLPVETFSPFGANVKTNILLARKLRTGEVSRQDLRICMIQASNVGYDATGREIEGSDLPAVTETAREFLQREGW